MKTTKTKRQRLKADPANMSLETNPVLKGGMPQALGMRVTSLTRKKVTGEMHITPLHCNWNGRVNG
ncbi:MAG: hypothetical protein ACXWIT_31610, partial [Burkholderiales bacterium]